MCSSTDESGWNNDTAKKRGIGLVRQNLLVKGIKSVAGRSYRSNASRIYQDTQKHPAAQVNLIATICLDWNTPVSHFEISERYTDGSIFAKFVSNRPLPDHVLFDILDRHGSHLSVKANEKRGDPSVFEVYEQKGVKPDFTPAGQPQFCPVEQLFGLVDKHLEDHASQFNPKGEGWDLDEMADCIRDRLESVTFKEVQSMYIRTWNTLYQGKRLPIYLRDDITEKEFYDEVSRARALYESKHESNATLRPGRISKSSKK